ncbi:hypothetical protein EK21DRAFT_95392 [Setomelanomma holmii]|uniref:Major facilitator superfamily (MFS) profile domain-containing protein n=1 Tax=Setomelanomma holmii TaxID=210430 RepID=A0A9P4LF35_9PLEO|nr:hypothetical protein EK21DRAFT_95392 [Setomelanomma holmii]
MSGSTSDAPTSSSTGEVMQSISASCGHKATQIVLTVRSMMPFVVSSAADLVATSFRLDDPHAETIQARLEHVNSFEMQTHSPGLLVSLLFFILLTTIDATSILFAVPVRRPQLQRAVIDSLERKAHLSDSFERIGSLAGDYAKSMVLFLAGRGMQGLGAGGLVALAYTVYGDMNGENKAKFLVAICCFTAAGTAGGPFIGAVISDSGVWAERRHPVTTSGPDYIGVALLPCSVVPLLIGLSLGSIMYSWTNWKTVLPLALGSFSLLLFVMRELCPGHAFTSRRDTPTDQVRLLELKNYRGADAVVAFVGMQLVGMIVRILAHPLAVPPSNEP